MVDVEISGLAHDLRCHTSTQLRRAQEEGCQAFFHRLLCRVPRGLRRSKLANSVSPGHCPPKAIRRASRDHILRPCRRINWRALLEGRRGNVNAMELEVLLQHLHRRQPIW
jgi:hypothetical protein